MCKVSVKSDTDSLPSNGADEESDQKDQELIVVASLLDKAPNLAGLSRTCEVPSTGLSPPLCRNALTSAERFFESQSEACSIKHCMGPQGRLLHQSALGMIV